MTQLAWTKKSQQLIKIDWTKIHFNNLSSVDYSLHRIPNVFEIQFFLYGKQIFPNFLILS